MADVKWIKITTDIFDDEKIILIESMPDAYAIITVWFKLLCLAGKQNSSGVFMLGKIAYTDKMLATIFRMKETTVTMALQAFEQFGMIEIIDGVITIPNWGKHQTLDQLESKKAYMRNYMSEYRNKQKALTSGETNCKTNSKTNGETNVSSADKEKDKDKEEEKEIKKERTKATSYDEILSSVADDELRGLYLEYIKMRKMIKAPMTDRALTMLIKKVNELEPNNLENQKKLLETAIMNNWKSVYPLKDTGKADNRQGSQPSKQEEEVLKMFGG